MFKKLKIKLLLINLFLVGIILLFIFLGIYQIMRHNFERDDIRDLNLVTQNSLSMDKHRPPGPPPMKETCYIKFNKLDSSINELSRNFPFANDEISAIVKKINDAQKNTGVLIYDKQNYKFMKTLDENYVIYAILNIQPEKDMLLYLSYASLGVGVVSLILVFFSSLFLASKALVPVKAAWERQKDFVADASHELRTPLTVIGMNLEIVLDNNEESVSSQMKWLENIKAENKRMTKMVEDLLFLARADSEEETLPKDNFNLVETIKRLILPFEPVLSSNKIVLTINSIDYVNFYGNEGRITELITILVDNAIKHTPPNGYITISLTDVDEVIDLRVSDTGEGIPKEHADKIFDRFYRIDKARSRNQGGSGLGLAIAKCIVEEHKGSICALSKDTPGATFRVTFPKN